MNWNWEKLERENDQMCFFKDTIERKCNDLFINVFASFFTSCIWWLILVFKEIEYKMRKPSVNSYQLSLFFNSLLSIV